MDITALQSLIYAGKICPYCKNETNHVHSSEIYGSQYDYGMMYRCVPCNAYVGCHTGEPEKALGRFNNFY